MESAGCSFSILLIVAWLGCSKGGEVGSEVSGEVFLSRPVSVKVPEGYAGEVSGIADSYKLKDHIWLVQDRGNPPEVLQLSHQGIPGPKLNIEGVENRDWEEVFLGNGPVEGRSYLYIADIGDNFRVFEKYTILRFPEPVAGVGQVKAVEKIEFRYDDGQSRNAEAMLVDPSSLDILVLTKEDGKTGVYSIDYPQLTSAINQARLIGTLPLSTITAASLSPDGTEVLLRNYLEAYYWKATSKKPLAELLSLQPVVVPLIREPQGEAISFSSSGNGFFSLSEVGPANEKIQLLFYPRR